MINSVSKAVSMPTRICLVRHGETDWNAQGRLQGHSDIALNAEGRAQAEAAAERLAPYSFAALYSSDLTRALGTAAPIAARLGIDIEARSDLRERFLGDFQGLTHAEAAARYPEDYAAYRSRDPERSPPGGGESLGRFAARIEATLLSLSQRGGGSLLIITHGGVLDVVHRAATGQSLQAKRNFSLLNAALNWVERRDGAWRLLSWADTEHLDRAKDETLDASFGAG